ncbi:hypothetical protein MCHLDSM_02052 [Mycolicibacterium chlorophenolicum]|uniref:Uncharacterized protein n=1 Tax=Mycolicibacterium chlorophenolicum TaxID=37916 RepID=A0A0J6W4B6_9MYCO|nr:hypothetical protein MCHLDSM_02052 [Mycolicibacterium chlorophenolicum]
MPNDNSQQLQAYLQAWRQLLESLAALAAAAPLPGIPPGLTPTPPAPPTPPAADPTQHLFGYVQAWRQYLEQAAGTVGRAPGTRPAAYAEDGSAQTVPPPQPGDPVPPTQPVGSRGWRSRSDTGTAGWPPKGKEYRLADNDWGGQLPGDAARRAKSDRRAVAPGIEDASVEVPASRYRQAAVIARGDRTPAPPRLEDAGLIVPLPTLAAQFKGLEERAQRFE